jgi:uncharacterized membrane protein YqjE
VKNNLGGEMNIDDRVRSEGGVIISGKSKLAELSSQFQSLLLERVIKVEIAAKVRISKMKSRKFIQEILSDERGDVPGWVLVVLMTTGLITAIWAIAEPRLSTLLRNSLDSMNTAR